MKRYRLDYSPRAARDLKVAYEWLEKESSTSIADRFFDGLRTFCKSLEFAPKRASRRRKSGRLFRVIGYKRSVTVIFSVQTDTVRILRVLYRGRDWSGTDLR